MSSNNVGVTGNMLNFQFPQFTNTHLFTFDTIVTTIGLSHNYD